MDTSDHRMDAATRAALREYVARVGWRTAASTLGVSCGAIRRSLGRAPVRRTTVVAVRVALALAMGAQEARR
jgi:hypothetical protein